MAGQPGKSGGLRIGAGRKPTRALFRRQVSDTETAIAAMLPDVLRNIKKLANGGAVKIEEEWQAAGTIVVEKPLTYDTGQVKVGRSGQALKAKQLAYPEKHPEEMVLVKSKVTIEPANPLVNIDLLNRILGKPVTPTDQGDIVTSDHLADIFAEVASALPDDAPDEYKEAISKCLERVAAKYSDEDQGDDEEETATSLVSGVAG